MGGESSEEDIFGDLLDLRQEPNPVEAGGPSAPNPSVGSSGDGRPPEVATESLSEVWTGRLATDKLADCVDAAHEEPNEAAPLVQRQNNDPGDVQMLPERVSVFRRRGRPNKALQEAMRHALAEVGVAELDVERGEPEGSANADQHPAPVDQDGPARKARRQAYVQQARVADADQVAFLKSSENGFCVMPPLAVAVVAASTLGGMPGEIGKDDIAQACREMVAGGPMLMATHKIRAELLGLIEQQLQSLTPLVGAAIFLLDRAVRIDFENKLALNLPKEQLLSYVDFAAYDETPLTVGLRGEGSGPPPPATAGDASVVPAPPLGGLCSASIGAALAVHLDSAGIAQKIVQTIQGGGMLFKVRGQYITILTSTICPLQVIDRGTGALFFETQRRLSGVSVAASSGFSHKCRLACTDSNKSNAVAERMLLQDRGNAWKGLHTFCEVHKSATAHEKTFSLQPQTLQGMIRCALALRTGSSMTRFRKCLRAEVASRFEVKHGSPPSDALQYKQQVLRLFVSHGSKLAMRRVLLAYCPNGDWRCEKVECYIPAGSAYSREQLVEHVASGLVAALCSSQPSIYPRSRWTGADLATDCLGVMEACHRLLSTTFFRYVAEYESAPRARRLLAATGGVPDTNLDPTDAPANADLQLEDAAAGGDEVQDAGGAAEADGGKEAATNTGTTLAEINAAHRRIATEWLKTKPLGQLILQRLVMEPLRQLQQRQFEVAGEAWEQKQRACALSSSSDGGNPFEAREYRLCVAASGRDEEKCLEQLRTLSREASMWDILPVTCFTKRFKALAFRMISRAGCAVHELIAVPHAQFPFKIFRLLVEPDLAPELCRAPPCLLDEWSAEMKAKHPSLSGPDLLKELELVCLLGWKDISQVEARHASVRRSLKTASLQTRPQEFSNLSALWSMQQAKKRAQRACQPTPMKTRRANIGCLSGSAFVSEECHMECKK